MFGPDAIPRPSGLHESQKLNVPREAHPPLPVHRKTQITELMQQQILLDREAKKEAMDHELAARLAICDIQKRNEDLKILAFDATKMNPEDASRIEALKDKTRATYFN
nr:hypothetical protein [Tanacetum cinerariifolium]